VAATIRVHAKERWTELSWGVFVRRLKNGDLRGETAESGNRLLEILCDPAEAALTPR